mmetsp:Transcript_3812/g.24107  ORF Transcript_3812/g.24107 Transcript_3812/m.24107 type:complete len:232 (+) Transcript_3812:4432-5127(+)
MFRLSEGKEERERKILECASTDPWLALVISVIHFEWNVRRACIALSKEPNAIVRMQLKGSPGLPKLSSKWEEILDDGSLQNLLGANSWREMMGAYKTRNRLVHGEGSSDPHFARDQVTVVLDAAEKVRVYAENAGANLYRRLQVRKLSTVNATIIGHQLTASGSLKKLHLRDDSRVSFFCTVGRIPSIKRQIPSLQHGIGVRVVSGFSKRNDQGYPTHATFVRVLPAVESA